MKKRSKTDNSKDNKHIQNSSVKKHFTRNSSAENAIWLYGKHPVFIALQKKRRQIFEILVTKNTLLELESFLHKNSLGHLQQIIKLTDNDKIAAIIGKNYVHQGLLASCSAILAKTQNELLQELHAIKAKEDKLPPLLLLDQISDPHNVGAIIRSALGFGVKKIIFLKYNSAKENAAIFKASAGTIEFADIAIVSNFSNLMEKLKKIGYWCFGLAAEGESSIQAIKNYSNIALIIGSEGSGIRNLVKKNCDLLVKIETSREVESLNASVAASIALYELSKK
jgi:23S rRNA (guanosine2251-2'-O)-methyltransferase